MTAWCVIIRRWPDVKKTNSPNRKAWATRPQDIMSTDCMTAVDTSRMTKVRMCGSRPQDSETLWATPIGSNFYRLENSPFFAYGVSWMDIVEALKSDASNMLEFVQCVRKSGNRTIRIIFETSRLSESPTREILHEIKKWDAATKGCNQDWFLLIFHQRSIWLRSPISSRVRRAYSGNTQIPSMKKLTPRAKRHHNIQVAPGSSLMGTDIKHMSEPPPFSVTTETRDFERLNGSRLPRTYGLRQFCPFVQLTRT
jgi:hypothetical protein